MKATWQGWWWWRALAWGLVAVVVLALLVSLWVFESDTPDDRCWQLPSSLTGTATGDFLALPLGNTQNLPNYKLLYQYPDHVSTYTQQMLEIGGVVDDFINWVWWRTLSALRDPMTGPKAVVLFVHGHGGSGRQVKELSVILQSLRPTLVDKPDHHAQLAVFSVHFAGELSALQGDVLRRQAAFVNTCIRYILNSLYPIPRPPKIVLVGHSMGGVVARAALTLPNNYAKSITALITLGAPLQTSLWPFDPSLVSFYHDLNTYRPPPNESVPTFSIAGGLRDHLIRTELSAFYGIEPAEQRLERGYAFTTAIPRVWTSIDHDSLLTCGQFVAVLGRCIMDIVNRTAARYYSSPHEQVFAAYRRHFLSPLPRLLGVKSSPEGLDMLLDDAQARPRVPESNATRNDTNANANATITDPTSFTPPPPPPLVEIINHTGQYLLLSGLANHTQIHNFSLPTWRARFGQMQLLVVTNLPPHVLRASLASNGTDVSIPDHWWIEPPVGYVPEAFRTSGIRDHAAHSDSPPESPKASPAPRILVLPARLLSQCESLLVHLSLSAPDPLNVMNNVTTEQPDADSSFVFVQLYSEYGAQVPVFDEDGGTFTLSTLDEGAEDASTASSSDRGLRPAVAHFVLPGHMQPISVYVRPIAGGGSAPSSAGPRWQPLIYQYSTCSAYMFEEENVYVDTSPAFIRSHYRTIPQLYRECGNATMGSVVHLFLFADPHHYYEVEIEPHVWVAVGHLFSSFVTLSLPSAFFIFALVFAVQRLVFARSGSLPSFAWVLLRWVAPAVVSVALVVSGALYAFDPPWYLLHESALVFASLPVMTPSFAFSHDPVANAKMLPLAPIVVVTYGILLVMVYALLQVFLVSCARPLTLRLVDRAREAIKQRKLCKCLNLGRVTQWDCRCVSAWPRSRFVLGWLVKAALAVLFVEAALRAPFYLSILAALVLTLVPAKDEPLSLFRQSLSVLLALLSTYHFGCLWFSWAATHPFDESAAFTLPTLALALFVSLLRRLPQAPLLHYSLAAVGAATAIYLCVFCWHAVHMIVYAIAGLSACALLGLASALLWSWLTVAALMLSGSTTIPQEEGDGEAAASAPVVATDTDQAAANDSVVRPFAALRRLYRRVFVFSLLRHRTEVLGLRPNEQDPNPENEEGGSAMSLHELHPL